MARTRRQKESDPAEELIQLAIDLDLTTLAEALPKLLEEAEKNGPSFTDFAIQLLKTEAKARKERRLQRSFTRSKLGKVNGIDCFDFSVRPKLDPRVVKELLNCRFAEEHRNILLLGPAGLGKTRVAKAIAHAACLSGFSVLCIVAAEMLEQLTASEADDSTRRMMRRYVKPDVLLLDEFGYEPFTKKTTNHLFRLVSARHQQASIILTANKGFRAWTKLFPTDAAATSTVDRLVDDATILRFSGKSFRKPREVIGAPFEDESDNE